ncbi:MAG TPA: LLM class F420-dependent oxidoreductase [Myxococcota bacterium]|nr:LLM class F420-dependent oxidoreductase [Myxococcota bacterium]
MKVGLIPVNIGVPSVEPMLAIAEKAEQVGIESVWTFEHVVVPIDYRSKYPYSADGKMGVTPETNFVDPLVALTAIAARTQRIRLGTGVNILPQTNPLYLAKQAASLDFVSHGRLMLGLGIGWLREEFEALGVPFERRGERFDDYVVALRKAWSGNVVEHRSDFIRWSGFKSHPLPEQKPGVPIVIGGSKGKAFERVAKHGDGWYAPTASVAQLEPMLKELAAACARAGRDPKTVEVSCMWIPAAEGVDAVKRYRDLGVSRLIVPLMALGAPPLDAIERFANDWLSRLT